MNLPALKLNLTHNSDHLPVSGQTFPPGVFSVGWKGDYRGIPGGLALLIRAQGRGKGEYEEKNAFCRRFPILGSDPNDRIPRSISGLRHPTPLPRHDFAPLPLDYPRPIPVPPDVPNAPVRPVVPLGKHLLQPLHDGRQFQPLRRFDIKRQPVIRKAQPPNLENKAQGRVSRNTLAKIARAV
jgi:hypothetical protein